MTYANPKEETLNLELTSYGRYLLSLGKLKPHEYAFFDDDIIYDRQYVHSSSATLELQNDIEGRIQEETPRLKPQAIYRGAQIGVFSEDSAFVNNLMPGVVAASEKEAADFLIETPESSYIFSCPIGTSAYNSVNAAAWNVGFYKAKLKSAQYAWTGSMDLSFGSSSTVPTTFIPQLNCDVQYEALFHPPVPDYEDMDETPPELFNDLPDYIHHTEDGMNLAYKLADNSYVAVYSDFALMKIEEENADFKRENFDLEVYLVSSEASGKNPEVLERLYFAEEDATVTNKHVEYYLQVDFDFDIEEEEFCSLNLGQEKIENIFIDSIFKCNDIHHHGGPTNIYGTAENQNILDEGDACD